MRLLAIDTATPRIVAGIVDLQGDRVRTLAERPAEGVNAHAEVLAPSVAEICAEAQLRVRDLDGVVVGLGPGPFTGLRVGIVTAASIADAAGIPVWGVCTLDALAPMSGRALVASDARRKEVYFACYDGLLRVSGPDVARPDDVVERSSGVEAVIQAGDAKHLDVLASIAPVSHAFPTPESLVGAAVRHGLVSGDSTALQPIYLRRPDAAEPAARPPLQVSGPMPA